MLTRVTSVLFNSLMMIQYGDILSEVLFLYHEGQSDGPSGQERSTASGAENDTVSTQLDETSASGMTVPEPLPAHSVPGREDKMVSANKMIP